jgi:hypothetical protein
MDAMGHSLSGKVKQHQGEGLKSQKQNKENIQSDSKQFRNNGEARGNIQKTVNNIANLKDS